MLKLSKEQADWLIEQLKKYHTDICGYHSAGCTLRYYEILKIINQCTEKKFPYLRMEISDQGSIELNGSIHRGSHVTMATNFKNVNGAVACIDLNHHEFKQFAEGVNKIEEYLNAEA